LQDEPSILISRRSITVVALNLPSLPSVGKTDRYSWLNVTSRYLFVGANKFPQVVLRQLLR
jgi:hypothetical protein